MMVLLTAALLLRAMLPQGFMWAESGAEFVMAFCSPSGQQMSQVLDPSTGKFRLQHAASQGDLGSEADQPCPFASTPALATWSVPPLDLSFAGLLAERPALLRQRRAALHSRPPLPARGPPRV